MAGKHWTVREDAILKRDHGRVPIAAIAKRLRRTYKSVAVHALEIGITRKYLKRGGDWEDRLRDMHALGWSDAEVGRHLGLTRKGLTRHRKRLGLPANDRSEWYRRRVAETTRRQCEKAGVKSLGELRSMVFRRLAREAGWPEDLRPRAVQILELLYNEGPKTRREICDLIGMEWRGSRRSLKSSDQEGTYLAHLIARGLVIMIPRGVKGKGKGKSVNQYMVPVWVEKNLPEGGNDGQRHSNSEPSPDVDTGDAGSRVVSRKPRRPGRGRKGHRSTGKDRR